MLVLDRTLVKPGYLGEYEAEFAGQISQHSDSLNLVGAWRTDVGQLNEAVHLWRSKTNNSCDPQINLLASYSAETERNVVNHTRLLLVPAPFSTPFMTRNQDTIYELRIYRYFRENIDQVISKWQAKIDARKHLSPMLCCGYTNDDPISQWVHLWPYTDMNERCAVRADAIRQGIWPPGAFEGLIDQESSLLIPAKTHLKFGK